MNFLVTGASGFIGFHLCDFLLKRNHNVYGVDDLNDYYDVNLKKSRLKILKNYNKFIFVKKKIEDRNLINSFQRKKIDVVINLAAQAGVRHSLENPYVYIQSNVLGQVNMFELARKLKVKKFIYASSSSVYGGNKILPFSIKHRVDNPISLYAASKKSTELIAEYYSQLYKIKSVGLRFFTVYGPWGRPDMATFIFTKNILNGKPINIFNYGKMKRDFTYIDDIILGINGAINSKAKGLHTVYNLGNSNPELLLEFIKLIEKNLGMKAKKKLLPLQPGDVPSTFADISESKRDLKFKPTTQIKEGIPKFISWYKKYYKI
jgi:UDP-glucuronate 4-epimerase